MSIASAIQNLKGRVQSAYTALSDKGAVLPEQESQRTTANLPSTIATISELKGETRIVSSSASQQIITPSEGKNGITQITITPLVTGNAVVTPSTVTQIKSKCLLLTGSYSSYFPGIYYSTDGLNWCLTNQKLGKFYQICYGDGKYIAVSTDGVYSSLDGFNWQKVYQTTDNFISVAYGNGVFVAISNTKQAYKSLDGTTWTYTTTFSNSLNNVSFVNNLFWIGGDYNVGLKYSSDGSVWNDVSINISGTYSAYSVKFEKGKYFSAGGSGIYYSTDGLSWSVATDTEGKWYRDICYDGEKFFAIGGSTNSGLFESQDGTSNWTKILRNFSPTHAFLPAYIMYVNQLHIYIIVSSAGQTIVSSDAVNWTDSNHFGANRPIFTKSNLKYLTGISSGIYFSEDMVNWTQSSLTNPMSIPNIIYKNNRYVVCSYNKGIFYSYDGIVWSQASGFPTNGGGYLAYSDATMKYIVAGRNNNSKGIYISDDGINWTQTSQTTLLFNGCAFGIRWFIATSPASNGPGVWYSNDGMTWSQPTGLESVAYYSSMFANDKFFVTSDNPVKHYYSIKGSSWNEFTLSSSNPTHKINNIAYGNGHYVCSTRDGTNGGPFYYSLDGINWTKSDSDIRVRGVGLSFIDGKFYCGATSHQGFYVSTDGNIWTEESANITAPSRITSNESDFYKGVVVEPVTAEIDSNIQAGNIKSGVTILGVNGTIEPSITPSGNINITSTAQTDVTNYATAQVVDSDLVAGNIKKDVNILGITGTYEGSGGGGSDIPVSDVGYTVTLENYGSGGHATVRCHKSDSSVVDIGSDNSTVSENNVVWIEWWNTATSQGYDSCGGWTNLPIVLTSNIYLYYDSGCILKGTPVNLWDGKTKPIEEINYDDEVLCWNFDNGRFSKANPFWIKKAQTNTFYWINKFKSGKVIKTTGTVAGHRFFDLEQNKFLYNTECKGHLCYTMDGPDILIDCKYVEGECEFYNVYTNYHMNLFANGILTGFRYNNLYPIKDMKFIKNNRQMRSREEFKSIPDSWFYGMRCAEQTDSVDEITSYAMSREIIKL